MSRKVPPAAGTVTLRPRPGREPQILVVHRPAYDDWTLPKGKLEPDEYAAAAAVRETQEETGTLVRLGHPLETVSYEVANGTKHVHYWCASVLGSKKRKPDAEVDKVAWLSPRSAIARMTYDDEKKVVLQALGLPPTVPLLLVRHAKAMLRKNWTGRDQARPITSRGRRQAQALIPLFEAFGVGRLASSTSVRCMQTLSPYAKKRGLDVQGWAILSEELGEDNPKGVRVLMQRLATEATTTGVPVAVSGHRPVLPTMLEALAIEPRPLQTASVVIAHLNAATTTAAVEFHRPRV